MKRRDYGPHDPSAVPEVVVLGAGKYPGKLTVPLPAVLLAQREWINRCAYGAGAR